MYGLLFQRKIAVLVLAMAVTCQFPNAVRAVGPEDAEEWKNNGDITVTVTSPADNTYRSINSGSLSLAASASDPDCYRVATTWYPYSDEVNSGDDASSYHIWWTKSGDGTLTDMYGGSGSYTAPDYSEGNNLRSVTISAHADDFNRSGDTYGYGDTSQQTNRTVNIWQVTCTAQQSGSESSNYNGTVVSAIYGGMDLGEVDHGDTVSVDGTPSTGTATGFHTNTQVKGSLSSDSNVPQATFSWYQDKKGTVKTTTDGTSWNTDQSYPNWTADGAQPWTYYVDGDSRNTEQTGNPDVNEIFSRDAPGIQTGANNDKSLVRANTIGFNNNKQYRSYVKYGGVRVSNQLEWTVQMELSRPSASAPNNKWARVAYQPR